MKTELIEKGRPEKEIQFPVLMERALYTRKLVVLFIFPQVGTVVYSSGEKEMPVGHYAEDWIEINRESVWKRYEGKVILSND